MAYTPHQKRMIALARQLSRNDTPKVQRALLEAMAVESNFRHLNYGDRDSVGVLQQRPSQGWGPASETPEQDINQFLVRARRNARGFHGTAGQLAQSVQRSAYPDRYDKRLRQANELLGGKLGAAGGPAATPQPPRQGSASQQLAGESMQSIIASQLMAQAGQTASGQGLGDPTGLAQLAQARQQAEAQAAPAQSTQQNPVRYEFEDGKVDAHGVAAVKLAQEFLGTPYSWGGGGKGGPSKGIGRGANTVGFDCSSLIQYTWAKQGVNVPRVTYDQWKTGKAVDRKHLQKGDAVFFHPGKRGPEHVGMYIGNGKFIEAPHTGAVVRISNLAGRSDYMGARRFGGR